jgi:hypothetical protein
MVFAQVGTQFGAGPLPTSFIMAVAILAGTIWIGLTTIGVILARRFPYLGGVSILFGFLIFIAPWAAYAIGTPPINSVFELSEQLLLWSPVYVMLLLAPLVAYLSGRRSRAERE